MNLKCIGIGLSKNGIIFMMRLPCHGYKEPIPFKANFVLLHHNISPIKNTSTNLQV